MNVASHLVQRILKLDPPTDRDLVVQHDLRTPMPDGVELLADRWAPRIGGDSLPTALLRIPYGRRGLLAKVFASPLAERGFQVLIQSTRGTFGSGGAWDPCRHERLDGLATIEWVMKQPWFGDSMVLVGPSYLGYAQWAVASELPPEVKAIILQNTESALTLDFLRKDAFSLETMFEWATAVANQERPFAMVREALGNRKKHRALASTLPLNGVDIAAIGRRDDYFQNVLIHDANDAHWAGIDQRHRVADVRVPVSSVGGWYDIFLPGQLRDFRILQEAGRPARLTIGPWTHRSITGLMPEMVRQATEFGLVHARGEQPPQSPPVRLFVMGEEAWRDFDSWPPHGYIPERFHLRSGGALTREPPTESQPDEYRYDPADPTPAVGGARMVAGSGRVDNTALEARKDVLTYTTDALAEDIEVIGDVSAEIWFRSSLPYADVFVRLCDIDAGGRSINVCDGLISLTGANETTRATVTLWSTAHRFQRGHRVRVQVSSGAFPRYARNHGTGEPHATATGLRTARQTILHDPEHPSAIILPVRQDT